MASLVFFVLLSGVKLHASAPLPSTSDRDVSPRKTTLRESAARMARLVFEGLVFLKTRPIILAAITLDLFAVLFGGAVYLLPIYAKDILEIGETGLGILRAAPAVGALCTALLLAHLPPMKHAGRNLLLAVAGFGIATIVFGFTRTPVLAWAMLFLTGAFDNVSVVVRHTLVQSQTPDEMRGRVSAVSSVFIGSSNQLGGFESGLVARLFSPTVSVVSGGIGTLIVVALTGALVPSLRKLRRLTERE
jgi:MFS family permease